MERTESRERPLLIAILVILSLNLIVTFAMCTLFAIAAFAPSTSESGSLEATSLPPDLATKEDRARLLEELRLSYNSGDNEQLLSLYGEAYQMELRSSDFDGRIATMRGIAPTINSGVYTHYEYEKLATGVTNFYLFYNLDTPQGMRKLKLTFAHQGDDPSCLTGINIAT